MRLLMVRLSALGDVVQSLGAVRALLSARPDIEAGFVTQRENIDLLDGFPLSLGCVGHRRSAGLRGYRATARSMRALRPDVVVDLQGNWKAAGLAWASGARRRVGLAGRSGRRERSSAVLLNERVEIDLSEVNAVATVRRAHPATAAAAVLRAIESSIAPEDPRLEPTADELQGAATLLRSHGVDAGRPFRILVASTPADPKAWPLSAMQREARREDSAPAVWLFGPAEAQLEAPEGVVALRQERGSLRQLIGLGGLCGSVGGAVWGPDVGALHVLAATGVRTTAMFGPQDPRQTAPPAAAVLQRADAPACVPCRSRHCSHVDGPVCMDFDVAGGRPAS